MAENRQGETAKVRELGAELRAARMGTGRSIRDTAQAARITAHSRISEQENGKRLLPIAEIEQILGALELSDDERARILGLARSAHEPGQLTVGAPSIGAPLAQLIDYERGASRITDVSPLLIPGLLQTSDYARSIMSEHPNAETMVALRSGRRDILTRRDPVELVALIDTEVLVRPIAPPDVMADQLHHLLKMAELDHVTIQLVSSTRPGYHPMLAGPFELIEFAAANPIVHLEHYSAVAFIWEEADVSAFMSGAMKIREGVAMTPERSSEVIAGIANGMETTK